MTVKGKYAGFDGSHRRLTAILKVIKRFESHQEAADWYEASGLAVPGNCMVKSNPPLELDKTGNPENLIASNAGTSAIAAGAREMVCFSYVTRCFLSFGALH